MCQRKRFMHMCRHQSIQDEICPEAMWMKPLRRGIGGCANGLDDRSDSAMPVDVASFCPDCDTSIKNFGTRSMPTAEERARGQQARQEYLDDCKSQLRIAMCIADECMLEKRRAVGDAAFYVAYYRNLGDLETEIEALEDAHPNDARILKEGKEKLLDAFEKITDGLWIDFSMLNEQIGDLLARYGLDQAHFIDRDPRNQEP